MSPGVPPTTPATPTTLPTAAAPAVLVRLFAALREQAGWSAREVVLSGGAATPLAVWGLLELAADAPPAGVRVAINQQFASWEAPLHHGDELAFLPPISGG